MKYKFKNGGTLKLQTASESIPTLEDYKNKKRQEMIDAAYQKSLTRTTPKEAYQYIPADENLVKFYYDNAMEFLKYKLREKGVPYDNFFRSKEDQERVLSLLSEEDRSFFENEMLLGDGARFSKKLLGASCASTATDNYGKKYCVSGNQTFAANPQKYGFKEIPMSDIQKGDLVQNWADVPIHMLMFNGYDEYGNPTYNYSDGGWESKNIKKNAHYYVGRNAKAYRFVGTQDDNEKWENEYNTGNFKFGGIVKSQTGGIVTPFTNMFTTKFMNFLNKYISKEPPKQKAIGPMVWAYNKSSKIGKDGGKIK